MHARNFVVFVLHVALIRSTSGTQANVENFGFKSYRSLHQIPPNLTNVVNYTAADYGSDSNTEEYSTNDDATDYTSASDTASEYASESASDYSDSESYSNKSRSSTKNSTTASDSDNDSDDSSTDLLTKLLTESYVGAVFLGTFLLLGALAVCWTFTSQKNTNSLGTGPDKGYSTFSNERDDRKNYKNSLDPTVLDIRPQIERGQAPARFLPDQALL
ncbi:hypothetical protein CYMTET_51135 [Cymbomonas tetramitiformis]|uniref:Uncharacterized protein n=1 Tax=Cymbomonas tetramitiformis TaxID=36881 RepID=A0AAE0BLQ4_9CHLO|nr:hypothetical protein CYMTET_51135 [Cymbomonas tetramitiformis]